MYCWIIDVWEVQVIKNQEQQLFLKALIKKHGNMEKCQKI